MNNKLLEFYVKAQTYLADDPLQPVTPGTENMPGNVDIWHNLESWVLWIVLSMCLIGFMMGAGMVGIGNITQRPHMAERGKVTMWWCGIGAVLAGMSVAIINGAFNAGKK